jgi:hypothetical protein
MRDNQTDLVKELSYLGFAVIPIATENPGQSTLSSQTLSDNRLSLLTSIINWFSLFIVLIGSNFHIFMSLWYK